jgi:hypothetical protein
VNLEVNSLILNQKLPLILDIDKTLLQTKTAISEMDKNMWTRIPRGRIFSISPTLEVCLAVDLKVSERTRNNEVKTDGVDMKEEEQETGTGNK